MLFKAGAFKIIRDEETNEWRGYDPVADKARKDEAKLTSYGFRHVSLRRHHGS